MEYFDARDFDLAGRIGRLKTGSGVIETPFLFPVVDPAKQTVSLEDIRSIGFNAIITNAYLMYSRMKGSVVDIHDFLKWRNPVMTDSGGYQILEYGDVDVDEDTIIEYQKRIGSDICVILDIPTGTHTARTQAEKYVFETIRRGWRALPRIMDSKQLWVLPVQGAPFEDLLEYSATISARLPYHIYSLGSPTVFLEKYSYDKIIEYTFITRSKLPYNKPLHVFGVGHPMIIPFLVAIGADTFDSASYILYARDGRLMFEWGTRSLNELFYLPCSCPVCSRFSVEELKEMNSRERIPLIAKHNLYVLSSEIRRVKQSIKEGRLWEYLEYRSKAHPSLKRAFNTVKKYVNYISRFCSLSQPLSLAILFLDRDSIHNPRIVATRMAVAENISRERVSRAILIPAIEKPFDQQRILRDVSSEYPGYRVLMYNPYLGLFPPELSSTYPYYQHETGLFEINSSVVEETVMTLLRMGVEEVVLVLPDDKVFRDFALNISRVLVDRGIKITIRESSSHV
ncbi:MAG: tRNA guanosine(15) transglycosylase TgtA [Desulfurococcaceae archaeon]